MSEDPEHDVIRSFETSGPRSDRADVVLVSMPFGLLLQPSIALGLLKPALRPTSVKTLYLTFPFAEAIGTSLYQWIAGGNPTKTTLVGEWIFSPAVFGSKEPRGRDFVDEYLRGKTNEETLQGVLAAREQVDRFLTSSVKEVLSYRPRVVGFTSVFQQQLASLALARRLKREAPHLFIVLGGANCESHMGLEAVRSFSFLDAVVSGEGDEVFPRLVARVLAGESIAGLQGVYTHGELPRLDGLNFPPNAPAVRRMDALPHPEYEEFLSQWQASEIDKTELPRLTFETARGCWWGEREHCTFCGLNGVDMPFRSKSADRALDELTDLARKYPGWRVQVVDNILDMGYFRNFIPELAKKSLDVELFYEVKANLKKEHVRLLGDAGINEIQPGIESLSSAVLKLMHKGSRCLQNLQLLKWCKQFGVRPLWNIIWGFPGEPPQEYERMAKLMPLLTHLPPPLYGGSIRLDRFSPNYTARDQLGFVDVEPDPVYSHLYPLEPRALNNLAYYFTFDYADGRDVDSYTGAVTTAISDWRQAHEKSTLFAVRRDERLMIWDTRPVSRRPLSVVEGPQCLLYEACDETKTVSQLRRLVHNELGQDVSHGRIEEWLRPLLEDGWMLREGNSFLSLAVTQELQVRQEQRGDAAVRQLKEKVAHASLSQ